MQMIHDKDDVECSNIELSVAQRDVLGSTFQNFTWNLKKPPEIAKILKRNSKIVKAMATFQEWKNKMII